jgi:NAD(P)-dependent dehydrogenase (short-subunit alcohol dehydrogenase family)
VVIGGSAGIGLETARQARAEGAEVIITGRNPERLEHAGRELGALSTAAFDATDLDGLERFFEGLPEPIDHRMLSGSGPYYVAAGRAGLRAGPHDGNSSARPCPSGASSDRRTSTPSPSIS